MEEEPFCTHIPKKMLREMAKEKASNE